MPWVKVVGPEADNYRCHLFEQLTRDDDGRVIGTVMQFTEGHAYYIQSANTGGTALTQRSKPLALRSKAD